MDGCKTDQHGTSTYAHMHIYAVEMLKVDSGILLDSCCVLLSQISVFAVECHVPNIMHLILQIVRVGCNKKTHTMTAIQSKSGSILFF